MTLLPVKFNVQAEADFESIIMFLTENGASAAIIRGFVGRIHKRAMKIGLAPFGGVARPELGKDIRMVPFEHSAAILYRVLDDHVEIISIVYGGKDYESAFRSLN